MNLSGAVEPAISLEDVHIGFEEGDVLRGVSFEVYPRETLILLGETGTGKTLTLKMAAGIFRVRRSEEHTSELQSRLHLVCRLLLEKKKHTHTCSSVTVYA